MKRSVAVGIEVGWGWEWIADLRGSCLSNSLDIDRLGIAMMTTIYAEIVVYIGVRYVLWPCLRGLQLHLLHNYPYNFIIILVTSIQTRHEMTRLPLQFCYKSRSRARVVQAHNTSTSDPCRCRCRTRPGRSVKSKNDNDNMWAFRYSIETKQLLHI